MLDPIVDLALGAEENQLAVFFADTLRHNLRTSDRARRSFAAMRAAVSFVAVDTFQAVTMRFDHGRVTLHEGTIGIPAVTFCGDREALLDLASVPLTRWLALPAPNPFVARDRAAIGALVRRLSDRRLIVYGFLSHPRLVTRVVRVLSSRS